MGARIEILELKSSCASSMVAPLAGARIEIMDELPLDLSPKVSLPSRERGLKFKLLDDVLDMSRRSPCGSVD